MFTDLEAEGTRFELLDPDASLLRDALPGQGYEPAVCALLADALAQPDAVFADIGALYGFFTVWAALRGAAVVAFEPNEHYARVLEFNLKLNACPPVRVERLALAERRRAAPFGGRTLVAARGAQRTQRNYARGILNQLTSPDSVGSPVSAMPGHWRAPLGSWLAAAAAERLGLFTRGRDQACGEAEVISLDEWIHGGGVAPSVVKIDVHGAEALVLRGMTLALRQAAHVVVEVHTDDLLVDGSREEIVATLEAAGLTVYELRGFRRARALLVELTGKERARFCDQRRWTAGDLYFMRCLYARRPGSSGQRVR